MTRTHTYLILPALAAALLAAGAAAGYFWARHNTVPAVATTAPHTQPQALYWYDPMVPSQHFDKPGKSPFMDMQLLPKYADGSDGGGGIHIDSNLQQSLGIRTTTVERGQLVTQLQVPGTLSWDLRKESLISARVEGTISQLLVKVPFTPVQRGQALAALLAPEWSSAVAEAQALRQAQSASARELQQAAQQRLHVLGVPGGRGRDGSLVLSAPRDGVISEVLVREGQAVMPGTPLFRVNGADTLWLEAAIPQAAVAAVHAGTPVQAVVSAEPGRTFSGKVEQLLPQIDPTSRTQRARIVLDNHDGLLAAGMFADVTLQAQNGPALPLLPTDALIATGNDSRVIVQARDGRFHPLRVRTGRSSNGRTEILAGLDGGERVVVSGQFLIDSEASLSGALERLPEAATAMVLSAKAASSPTSAPRCPVQHWYDPMKPEQHFDQPGKSPFMDMPLLPAFAAGATADCTINDIPSSNTQVQP